MTADDGRWHPGIGDPTVIGWVTVVAYAGAFMLCALCRQGERQRDAGPSATFWTAMTVTMLLLGINKQLDLQTWFTEVGRDVAMAQGWYARRFTVQVAFIAGLAVCGVAVLGWLQWRLRHLDAPARGAAAGLVLLAVFIVMRAASFHHVDHLLGLTLGPLRINAILELSGIGCVAAAAGSKLKRLRPIHRPAS